MSSLPELEDEFKEAVGKLPNYKRHAAFHYVSALRKIIEGKDKTISRLSDDVINAYEQGVKDGLSRASSRPGDGDMGG